MGSTFDWMPAAVGAVAALAALYSSVRAALGSYKRDVAENRQRLQRELQISADGSVAIREPPVDAESENDGESSTSATTHNTYYHITVDQAAAAEDLRAEREEQTFSVLLADYYAHGLTQAQRSSIMSLTFSGLGCLILFVGVAMAIWRSETTGELYAAMVTNVTGIVTGTVGVLFHRQARGAMDHLASQTKLLRQDMRSERGTRNAIRLVEEVIDPTLKGRLQAALILKFSDATLPDVAMEAAQPGVPTQHANGEQIPPTDRASTQ
ncbi:TRADD-N-associated membrane domain-containing protein [Streptomyces microflavus]|uniref:TRADD-N-associated membrane domain-containing protein n=1 Tax=Streptomyces microflavus TaxID=1919 RepID=UPI0036C1854B